MNKCIICESKKLIKRAAFFAPFLIARMFNNKNKHTDLLTCRNCHFNFSSYRPSDKEMSKLYKDYRGKEYFEQRNKFEPFYTKEFNDNLGCNPEEIEIRKKHLINLTKKYLDISKFQNILDYGGDAGQYIPDELAIANRYVYEVSKVKTIDGILNIDNEKDLDKINWDFIMCCCVLEHVSDPLKIINKLIKILNKKGYLYIEVPYEGSNLYKDEPCLSELIKIWLKCPILFLKYFSKTKSPAICIHEHINMWRKKTFEQIFNNKNVEIIFCKNVENNDLLGQYTTVNCLIRKK